MAYKIEYIPVGKRQYSFFRRLPKGLPIIGAALFLGALILLKMYYGTEPADLSATDAIAVLIGDLRDGARFTDAVTAFCREVLIGGA